MIIGKNLFKSEQLQTLLKKANHWVVLTPENLPYASQLGLDVITFPSGEKNKTRETKQSIEDEMLRRGYGRDSGIIIVGGGVATDLGGFVAATYCRGIPTILFPTTLLAMVDASIGGKTGVNTPFGKNLVGAIHLPLETFADIETLKTLPLQELKNGIIEMIKHGLIQDKDYFEFIESNLHKILALEEAPLIEAIQGSVRIKEKITQEDLHEKGKRQILNFGHTVGHAIEHLSNYQYSHGQAVGIGMLKECEKAQSQLIYDRIYTLLTQLDMPTECPYSDEQLLSAMKMDKKSKNQVPQYVVLREIGKTNTLTNY